MVRTYLAISLQIAFFPISELLTTRSHGSKKKKQKNKTSK